MRDLVYAGVFLGTVGVAYVAPSYAETGYDTIETRAGFVAATSGKTLTQVGIRLNVRGDGSITGRAFGQDVRGTWTWEGPYFCRTLSYGKRTLERNCQTVEKNEAGLRFTADQGQGDTAKLRLR